jgi:hypothetical protein
MTVPAPPRPPPRPFLWIDYHAEINDRRRGKHTTRGKSYSCEPRFFWCVLLRWSSCSYVVLTPCHSCVIVAFELVYRQNGRAFCTASSGSSSLDFRLYLRKRYKVSVSINLNTICFFFSHHPFQKSLETFYQCLGAPAAMARIPTVFYIIPSG